MSGGTARFETVKLPKDTASMIDKLVEETAAWAGMVSVGLADTPAEREQYKIMCYARKWLSEHVELLCQEAGVEPSKDDRVLRFL